MSTPGQLLSATGDSATPSENGVRAAKILKGSVLVTAITAQHAAYGRQTACLDTPFDRYLIDLKVPKKGIRCTIK